MLIIWTGAEASVINKVIGPVLLRQNVPHKFKLVLDNALPPTEQGDVVLACGGKAVDIMRAAGLVPKGRTIGSLREKVVRANGVKWLVTYDPKLTMRDYARSPEVEWDIILASRVASTGSERPPIDKCVYEYVDHFGDLIDEIDDLYEKTGKPVASSCDLETIGLVEYAKGVRIVSISFTIKEGHSRILYFEKGEKPVAPVPWKGEEDLTYWEGVWVQINWLLTSKKIKTQGANFKFDTNWMIKQWGITCTNQTFDTLLVGSLLDENRSNSLKLHAKLFTSIGGYDEVLGGVDMSRMDLVPREKLRVYAGGDTDATHRVAAVFRKQLLQDKKVAYFYTHLLQPSAMVFAKMERNGILVDVPYMKQLEVEIAGEKVRLAKEMLECVPRKLRIKYGDKITSQLEDEKSPFTPAFLKEFLFTKAGLNLKPVMFTDKTQEPSSSKDHLMRLRDDPDAANFTDLYFDYNSAAKTLSTFVIGFMKHLRPDGRFHPTYMLYRGGYGSKDDDSGTNSGRTSAKDPAAQTLQKRGKWAKKLRKAYIAPKGKIILQLDFSQGELRITACVADEPTMIKAYRDGLDLHSITAAMLSGYEMGDFMALPDEERELLRYQGKAGNFGLIYGMQPPGFREYARNDYNVIMSLEEASQAREAFFTLYNRLPKWHEDYVAEAHRWEQIRSPIGRVRHLPLINSKEWEVRSQAERQAINAPVQSCLSDMMQLAMVLIDREYPDSGVEMFLMTHDSIAAYVPEDDPVGWAKKLKVVMENLPLDKFGWKPALSFPVDAEVGGNLAELKKLKSL